MHNQQHNAQQYNTQQQGRGFFAGIRNLGIYRGQGWIGGVATGYANRLNIDVVIVRGIFVVGAIVGLPLLLFYAASWLLLPDLSGRILIEEIKNGRWEPSVFGAFLIGIIGLTGIGFLSWGIGAIVGVPVWILGSLFWPLLLLASLGVIIWAMNIKNRPPKPHNMPQNPYASSDESMPQPQNVTEQEPPFVAESPADAWNQRAQMQAEEAAQKAEQEQQLRLIQQRYRMEQNEVRRRQMEEYRRKNPRITASEIFLYLGAAFLIGGILGLAIPEFGFIGALASGLAVLAIGMIVTGLRGRKSALLGFLAFLNAIMLVGSVMITGAGAGLKPNAFHEYVNFNKDNKISQLNGYIELDLTDTSSFTSGSFPGNTYEINQLAGNVHLNYALNSDLTVRVDVNQTFGSLDFNFDYEMEDPFSDSRVKAVLDQQLQQDDDRRKTFLIGPSSTPDFYVVINQTFGNTSVYVKEKTRAEWLDSETDATSDSPSTDDSDYETETSRNQEWR